MPELLLPCFLNIIGLIALQVQVIHHPLPEIEEIKKLPVQTIGVGNTLIRGNNFTDKTQTWMQLYTSDMAVSPEGYIYLTTPWEEGLRSAGIYKDGDALPDVSGMGVNSGEAVALSKNYVTYARWIHSKEGKRKELVLFQRKKGLPLDPSTKRVIVIPGQISTIAGLAIDEQNQRIFISDGNGIRAVAIPTGKIVADFEIRLERSAKLELDNKGDLWVIQKPELGKTKVPVQGAVFGSEPLDQQHSQAQAVLESQDQKVFFEARDKENGFVGLSFPRPEKIDYLRFMGDLGKERFAEIRIQGSHEGKDGPWIDLGKLQDRVYGWPEEWFTISSNKPLKAIRFQGPNVLVRRLAAFQKPEFMPGKVFKYEFGKKVLTPKILDIPQPQDLAFDAKNGRLYVASGAPEHQIHGFSNLDSTPERDMDFANKGRLGVFGGWRSGKGLERGTLRQACFENIRGIGVDDDGKLYVCNVGNAGMCQTSLECYSENNRIWKMEGTSFLDTIDHDPLNINHYYSTYNQYQRTPNSNSWKWIGSTLDSQKYPEDGRIHGNALVYGVRNLHGKKFLVTTTQHGSPICVFRFGDNDQAGIPAVVISPRVTGTRWPPHQPLGFGAFIWRDKDGDGHFSASEFEKAMREDSDMMFPNVDENGDLWFFTRIKGKRFIRKLALAPSLDQHGSPVWSWTSPENCLYAIPKPLDDPKARFGGFEIDGRKKEIILFGFPADKPNECGQNWPLGRFMQRCVVSDNELIPTHSADLLHNMVLDKRDKDQAYGAALCGEYLFVAWQQHFTVLVYRRKDLHLVGRLDLGAQVIAPLMDGQAELIVRNDGAGYQLITPHYVANAVHIRMWNGKTDGWLPVPKAQIESNPDSRILRWDTVQPGCVMEVERRILGKHGWSEWESFGNYTEKANSLIHPISQIGAYRLRMKEKNDSYSDWSHTFYFRN